MPIILRGTAKQVPKTRQVPKQNNDNSVQRNTYQHTCIFKRLSLNFIFSIVQINICNDIIPNAVSY